MRKRVLGLLAAIVIAFSCILIPVNVLARTETGDESQSLTEEEQKELDKAEKESDYEKIKELLDKSGGDYYEWEREQRQLQDYYIEDLKIDIVVNENNTFDITEKYKYNFVQSHHGMTRTFVLNHKRYYENYKSANIKANVEGLTVTSKDACADIAKKERNSNSLKINVGDKDEYCQGIVNYTLKYKYHFYSPDPIKDADELYFNIVGVQNECPVKHVSWKIHMPKDFDTSTIGYSTGTYMASGFPENKLKSTVKNNVIIGEYLDKLSAKEGITIRATLPEGYFKFESKAPLGKKLIFVFMFIPLLFCIPLRGIKRPVQVVNFYPPKAEDGHQLDPLEVETIFKAASPTKTTAMIPYLAQKGYFNIVETTKDTIKKKFKFVLNGLDARGELTKGASLFLNGIFKNKKTAPGSEVTLDSLKERFYKTNNKVIDSYKELADKQYDKASVMQCRIGYVIAFVCFTIANALYYTMVLNNPVTLYEDFVLLFGFGAATTFIMFVLSILSNKAFVVCEIIQFLLFLGFRAGALDDNDDDLRLLAFIAATACIILAITFLLSKLKNRSDESIKLYGEVLGFRNFIKVAEVDRLKALCEENPSYFFDILPYAYVLGLHKGWMRHFDTLTEYMAEPTWYVGSYYSYYEFNNAFNSLMSSSASTVASQPASSGSSGGGGGFSGGGFSGGGSGGGGAGAW